MDSGNFWKNYMKKSLEMICEDLEETLIYLRFICLVTMNDEKKEYKKENFRDKYDMDQINIGIRYIELVQKETTDYTTFLWQKFYILILFNTFLISAVFTKDKFDIPISTVIFLSIVGVIFSLVIFFSMTRGYMKGYYLAYNPKKDKSNTKKGSKFREFLEELDHNERKFIKRIWMCIHTEPEETYARFPSSWAILLSSFSFIVIWIILILKFVL